MKTSIAFLACTILVTPALADFTRAPPPPPFTDGHFECAIVGHTSERDSDPVYKFQQRSGFIRRALGAVSAGWSACRCFSCRSGT
jgi:hypothetical protein